MGMTLTNKIKTPGADPRFLERGVQPEKGHTRRAPKAQSTEQGLGGPSPEKFENSSANMHFPGIWV
jgi:hypothetical protein